MDEADLFRICGERSHYTLDDARRIMKKQWTADTYAQAVDFPSESPTSISPARMLAILQERARYTMERGATLNNPHVTKRFLGRFDEQKITRDHAGSLRRKLSAYLREDASSPDES